MLAEGGLQIECAHDAVGALVVPRSLAHHPRRISPGLVGDHFDECVHERVDDRAPRGPGGAGGALVLPRARSPRSRPAPIGLGAALGSLQRRAWLVPRDPEAGTGGWGVLG